jgi:hypothetical protein
MAASFCLDCEPNPMTLLQSDGMRHELLGYSVALKDSGHDVNHGKEWSGR